MKLYEIYGPPKPPSDPPKPYDAEVEYLESTGTQYIDTGIVAYLGTSLHLIMSPRETYNSFQNCFCGAANEESSVPHYDINARNGYITIWNGNSFFSSEVALAVDKLYDVTIDASTSTLTTIVNGEQRTTSRAFQMHSSYTFFIFALNDKEVAKRNVKMRLFSFSITNPSGVLVRDFIPVRFTNELGQSEGAMYDRVSGQLFRNQGTDSFNYGADVYHVPSTVGQYVQSGLVAMWDGIENVGKGMHSDNATAWVDLTGNHALSYQFTPSFTSNAFILPGTNQIAYCDSTLWRDAVNANQCTVEMCFKGYSCGGNNSIISLNTDYFQSSERAWWWWGQIAFAYRITSGSSWVNQTIIPNKGENETMSLSFPLADCYYNGSIVQTGTTGTSAVQSKVLVIGRIANFQSEINGYSSMRANIHSIRIYNKVLTATEIAANYAVDKQRFNLP